MEEVREMMATGRVHKKPNRTEDKTEGEWMIMDAEMCKPKGSVRLVVLVF